MLQMCADKWAPKGLLSVPFGGERAFELFGREVHLELSALCHRDVARFLGDDESQTVGFLRNAQSRTVPQTQ